ncbi:hypothetical protein ABZ793_21280 [Micromonospora sp. NPDC047465]|uniref:hypothetical protein n=1 Tax=Micromonospora sp. NPDC047465 TaxID=3154813 RepID=UPI0033FBBF63
MPIRSGFLLFPFSAADQGRISAPSLTASDVAFAAAPVAGGPFPQAMQLAFRLTAGSPLPQVRPLFPGRLRFIPDPAAPGITPEPSAVQFTSAEYAKWRTVGTIRVAVDLEAAKAMNDPAVRGGLEILPAVVWYGPVRISEEFLFNTLRTALRRGRVGGTPSIPPTHANWAQHAVARFLEGRYEPVLRPGASAAADDRIANAMPTVHPVDAQSNVALRITMASRPAPKDGSSSEFDALTPGAELDDPAHAANGVIPARHVLRVLRPQLTDGAVGATVPDAVLATGGTTPVYRAVRFTRVWKPVADCSVHFPAQRVRVADAADTELATQRLPAHGMFFWSYPADAPVTDIRLSIVGGMRWIDGAAPDVWRLPAGDTPIAVDLAATPAPHVQLRLRMREAMLVEPRDRPGGYRCTFMSMRRSVRALVDNRICGGRLNFGRSATNADTVRLMNDAWAAVPARANILRNNQPLPNSDPAVGAPRMIPVLQAFFPDPVPAQTIGGSTNRTTVFDGGEMAYHLWQSRIDLFHAAGAKRNFPTAHVGRGGAGALVATGLAAGYHLDPTRNAGETDDAYFDRIVGDMLTGLEPGAVLQFWYNDADFEGIKATQTSATAHAMNDYGHSPVFLRYVRTGGVVTAIRIIDQGGERNCAIQGPAGSRRIEWHGDEQAIWTTANWTE